MFAIALVFIAVMVLYWGLVYEIKHKNKRVKSTLGADVIASIAYTRTEYDELEEWWEANRSKDAEIKRLKEALVAKTRSNDLRQQIEKVFAIPTPILSDPSRVTILPDTYYQYQLSDNPKLGLKVEGELAKSIMRENVRVELTIENGKVVDWSVTDKDMTW